LRGFAGTAVLPSISPAQAPQQFTTAAARYFVLAVWTSKPSFDFTMRVAGAPCATSTPRCLSDRTSAAIRPRGSTLLSWMERALDALSQTWLDLLSLLKS